MTTERKMNMSLTGVQRVFAVDEHERVRANVAYVKTDRGVFGAYYGYSGGGAYDDGYFFITPKDKVTAGSDLEEFPKHAAKVCEQLSSYVQELLDHDEEEGGITEMGIQLKNKGNVFHSRGGWEHRSSRVTQKVLRLASSHWGLSFSWN
jgi:hypothetical protein